MLKSMSLTNFRSWEELGGLELKPITIVFGANSSGKTALRRAPTGDALCPTMVTRTLAPSGT